MQTDQKKSRNIFQTLGLVTVEEEIPAKNPSKQKATTASTSAPVQTQAYVSPPITAMPSSNSDKVKTYKQTLESTIQQKALGNFDYLKYKSSTEQLKTYIPDEASRFKAAFVGAAPMGVTKQKLLDSTQHYLSVLDAEKQEFDQATQLAVEENVTKTEKQLQDIEQSASQKKEQIKTLMDEVNDLDKQKIDLSSKLNEEKSVIAESSNSFITAFNLVSGDIRSDIQKINTYISE